MATIVKKVRFPLEMPPELRNHIRAAAALQGKTMKDWIFEAIFAKLEDDIDSREGLKVLGELEGTVSLRDYLAKKNLLPPSVPRQIMGGKGVGSACVI